MKKKFTISLSSVIFGIAFLISSMTWICNTADVFAADNVKLQVYLEAEIMDESTGEIPINVCMRNFEVAIPDYMGDICGLSFKFTYDADNFKIKQNDGKAELYGGIVENIADVEFEEDNGVVSVIFLDSTLMDNLAGRDGTLFGFTLVSANPKKLWNSFDTYPLRFVPGTVGAAAYNVETYDVSGVYNIEAIDTSVGGYNKKIDFSPISIDKAITFTVGSGTVVVNDGGYDIDAIPYTDGEDIMVPVRYLAEAVDCEVVWDGDTVTASAYGVNKTLAVKQSDKPKVYLNAAEVYGIKTPSEINGRIYIPLSLVTYVYPNARINVSDARVEIYIP